MVHPLSYRVLIILRLIQAPGNPLGRTRRMLYAIENIRHPRTEFANMFRLLSSDGKSLSIGSTSS